MSRVGRLSIVLITISAAGLCGCTTTAGSGRAAIEASTDTQTTPEERVVKTGFPSTEASGVSTTTVEAEGRGDPSIDRGNQDSSHNQTVQVSCPEPSNAQPGQCFTRVLYPAKFSEQAVQQLVRPAYEKITYTDPVYEDVQEQVVVREAYTRQVEVPALYDTYYEQILEKPAGKVWKKGRGAVERVDPATGEIYCLFDQPAVYRTVERKVLKRPAGTRTEEVPAEYGTKTVRKLVTPPQEVRSTVPAEYTTVTKKVIAAGDSCEFVQVLCEDNATQAKIHEVEQALQARGYKVDADGVDDEDLVQALRQFQEQQGLPQTGLMTARTLEALGVAMEPVQQPSATTSTR